MPSTYFNFHARKFYLVLVLCTKWQTGEIKTVRSKGKVHTTFLLPWPRRPNKLQEKLPRVTWPIVSDLAHKMINKKIKALINEMLHFIFPSFKPVEKFTLVFAPKNVYKIIFRSLLYKSCFKWRETGFKLILKGAIDCIRLVCA